MVYILEKGGDYIEGLLCEEIYDGLGKLFGNKYESLGEIEKEFRMFLTVDIAEKTRDDGSRLVYGTLRSGMRGTIGRIVEEA